MGIFDRLFKNKKEIKDEENKQVKDTDRAKKKFNDIQSSSIPKNTDTDYYDVLYSEDYTGKKRTNRLQTPPRTEWENVSTVENKIDRLYSSNGQKSKGSVDIEKKIDKILKEKL